MTVLRGSLSRRLSLLAAFALMLLASGKAFATDPVITIPDIGFDVSAYLTAIVAKWVAVFGPTFGTILAVTVVLGIIGTVMHFVAKKRRVA